MIKIGDKLSEINSIDQNGEEISLEQFKGKEDNFIFLSKKT